MTGERRGRPARGQDGDCQPHSWSSILYAGLDPEQNEKNSAQSWGHSGRREKRREVGCPDSISMVSHQAFSPWSLVLQPPTFPKGLSRKSPPGATLRPSPQVLPSTLSV